MGHLNLCIFTEPGIRSENLIIDPFGGAGGIQRGVVGLLVWVVMECASGRVLRKCLPYDLAYRSVPESGDIDLCPRDRSRFRGRGLWCALAPSCIACCFITLNGCCPLDPLWNTDDQIGCSPAPCLFPLTTRRATSQLLFNCIEVHPLEVTCLEILSSEQFLSGVSVAS